MLHVYSNVIVHYYVLSVYLLHHKGVTIEERNTRRMVGTLLYRICPTNESLSFYYTVTLHSIRQMTGVAT
jgi:hypothetical protein